MRFRQRMIGLVTVGLLVSTTVSVGVVAAEDPSLAKSMRFRESVGFPFDTATVAKVAADPAADRAFGVALTAAEAANLRARIAVQDEIGDVVDYINRDPRSFGHVWLDQKDGGAVVLQSRGAPDDAIRKAKGLAPDGAKANVGVGSGDSGGPIYIGSREFGLVKAAQGGSYMWYSTIDWVNSVLGTRSCLTASC